MSVKSGVAARFVGGAEPFILTAMISLLAGTVWLFRERALMLGHFYRPEFLSITHTITLGWISMLMMGVLVRLAPHALGVKAKSRRWLFVQYLLMLIGFTGMVFHFWISLFLCMATAAIPIVLAAAVQIYNFGGVFSRLRGAAWLPRYVAAAMINFLLAATLGTLLGFNKVYNIIAGEFFPNIFAHAHPTALGRVTMMIIGFEHRLLPISKPDPDSRWPAVHFWLLEAGILGLVVNLLAVTRWIPLFAALIAVSLWMHAWRPLGMGSTAVKFTPAMRSRLAEGHSANLTPVKNWDLDSLVGAGGIRSTTNDMLKYVAAYMGLKQSPLSAAMERAQQDLKDTTIPNMDIGLAWHLRKNPDSVIVWHNGGTGGYHSYVGFDRKKGIGVVVLSNSSNSIDDIGVHLLDPRAPLAKYEPKKERKEITINPSLLDAYVGEYKLAQNFILTITKENERLYVQATGQPRVQLHPEAETKFFLAEVDAQVSFVKDGTGKVTQLTLHQGGRDQKTEKIR